MAGLINTGLGYQNSAMSGFIRESADEAKRDQENKRLALAQKNQNMSMMSQGAGIGASIYSGTNLGGGVAMTAEDAMAANELEAAGYSIWADIMEATAVTAELL